MLRDVLGTLSDFARRYGDCVYYRIGPARLYQFSHPDQLAEALSLRAAAMHKPARTRHIFGRFLGDGLILSDGPLWVRRRRMVQAAMQHQSPAEYVSRVVRHTRDLFGTPQGDAVEIRGRFDRLTVRVGLETVAGPLSADEHEEQYLAIDYLMRRASDDMVVVRPDIPWPTEGRRRFRAARDTVRSFLEQHIAERRRERSADDVLAHLVHGPAGEDEPLADPEIRDEAAVLVAAGKETTSAALIWTAWLLARHPQAQERAAAEVDAVVGQHDVTLEDLPRLTWLTQCVKESMRLYPPVYLISRETAEPVEVGGYLLPKGAQLFLPVWVTHRDERWFPEPLEFRPERFAPTTETELRTYAYLPFGLGPRACVGRQSGMNMTLTAIATLLQSTRLRCASDAEPPLETAVGLHPRGGLLLETAPRENVVSASR
jgi:cytochrome P450